MERHQQYIFLIEDEQIAKSDLLRLFGGDGALIQEFLGLPFIRQSERGTLTVPFVGVITVSDLILCCFPKYYNRSGVELTVPDMALIIRTLKKIGAGETITPDFVHLKFTERAVNPDLVIADHLIRDYLEHGIYKKEFNDLELNRSGEISWSATIGQVTPIFSRGRPIYADTLNHTAYSVEERLITELQKFVVRDLLLKYGPLLNYSFRFEDDAAVRLSDIASPAYLSHVLQKELAQVFTDRKIQLLKLLIAYVKRSVQIAGQKVYFYGTAYYHVIWEKLLGSAFGNQVQDHLPQLPAPQWHDLTGQQVSSDTFRPDIIRRLDDGALLILDAKYYNLFLLEQGPHDLRGNPGIGDISKQFLYEKALLHVPGAPRINGLLFPRKQPEPYAIAGTVTFEIFPDQVLSVIYIDPEQLMRQFLANRIFPAEVLEHLAEAIETPEQCPVG